MKNVFVSTENFSELETVCGNLRDPSSFSGPSLAQVIAPAGRGKSEAAKRIAAHTNDIYIFPWNQRTAFMLLKEICFELAMEKPGRMDLCLSLIEKEMARERRLIMIDEADLLKMSILEMCRNLNERCSCPIVFIGESGLSGKLAKERRMSSRIRFKMEFKPVTQADIAVYFEESLGATVPSPEVALAQKYAEGDWRPIQTLGLAIYRAISSSNLTEIPQGLVRKIIEG